jgi:Cu-Zn family superoxide dismutase
MDVMLFLKRDITVISLLAGLVILITAGCGTQQSGKAELAVQVTKAIAVIHGTEGNDVQGIVTFTQESNGIKIVADITGLTPGEHGFHIHELGNCSAPNATSAGGHYNPENKPHGGPNNVERHVGDLGNIVTDKSGHAVYERTDNLISLNGTHSIIGRSIIIHANPDDLKTQPTGNAGPRVACGVIGISSESQ